MVGRFDRRGVSINGRFPFKGGWRLGICRLAKMGYYCRIFLFVLSVCLRSIILSI